jgi:predicted dithiol-disulfide oxidoreductase (DUF899 family)
VFDGPTGPVSLSELFGGNSQLVVYHFMFAPSWQAGCKSCSLAADHLDRSAVHLVHHDVAVVAVSRAPHAVIAPFQRRMGWTFPWVSSHGTDFNYDFRVSITKAEIASGRVAYNYKEHPADAPYVSEEMPGLTVFTKDSAGEVFHTYSSYARGAEEMLGVYTYLDVVPGGRNEQYPMDWVRYHDAYDAAKR